LKVAVARSPQFLFLSTVPGRPIAEGPPSFDGPKPTSATMQSGKEASLKATSSGITQYAALLVAVSNFTATTLNMHCRSQGCLDPHQKSRKQDGIERTPSPALALIASSRPTTTAPASRRGQATDSGTASRHRANVTTADRRQAVHTGSGHHVITATRCEPSTMGCPLLGPRPTSRRKAATSGFERTLGLMAWR
jgi:hypothetical protein